MTTKRTIAGLTEDLARLQRRLLAVQAEIVEATKELREQLPVGDTAYTPDLLYKVTLTETETVVARVTAEEAEEVRKLKELVG